MHDCFGILDRLFIRMSNYLKFYENILNKFSYYNRKYFKKTKSYIELYIKKKEYFILMVIKVSQVLVLKIRVSLTSKLFDQ